MEASTTSQPAAADRGTDVSRPRFVERIQERVKSRVSEQKNRATEGLMNVASTVRRMGEPLRGQPYGPAVEYVDGAAQRIEEFAHYLQERNADELVEELRSAARRNPSVFIGAGFVIGAICGRFLKSSSRGDGSERGTSRL